MRLRPRGAVLRYEAMQLRACGERWFCAASLAGRRGDRGTARQSHQGRSPREGGAIQLADESDTPAVARNIDVLARTLAARGHLLPATRLWGAAEVLRERTGLTLSGYWIAATDEAIATTRELLHDDHAFGNAWNDGRAMGSADAIALARSHDLT